VQLTIAPLRERIEDVGAIAEDHLWRASEHSDDAPIIMRDSALGELAAHVWPENVRELVCVLESACATLQAGSLTAEVVRKAVRRVSRRKPSSEVLPLERIESDYIVAALALCEGNQTLAARRLGIGRSTLLRKLKASAPHAL
jgi:DNA-binding NtrC family response regulator